MLVTDVNVIHTCSKKCLILKETDAIDHELNQYEGEAQAEFESNPLRWWNDRKEYYPLLYPIAMKFLSRPPTSVFIESVFSETRKREKNRNNISNELLNAQTIIKKNYKIRQKIEKKITKKRKK